MINMIIKYVQVQLLHQVQMQRLFVYAVQKKDLAMTTDCNSRYIYLDPEVGGKIAVAEAARNIVCSGARTTCNYRLLKLW